MKAYLFRLCRLFLCLSSLVTMTYTAYTSVLLTGSIQFPPTIKKIPHLFICSTGCQITGTPDDTSHKFSYTVSRPRTIQRFWLVISQHLYQDLADQNTVQCWRVDTAKPYKFYALTRILDESVPTDNQGAETQPRIRWNIQSQHLTSQDGRLPDDVIIVYYDPTLVADIRGGSPLELPTLVIRNDIVSFLGSETALHDISEKLSLAAMDLRPFFSPIEYEIHQNAHVKTIIALTT